MLLDIYTHRASANSTTIVCAQVTVSQRHAIVSLLTLREQDYRLDHLQKIPRNSSIYACHTPSGQSTLRTGSWLGVGQIDGRLILVVLNWRRKLKRRKRMIKIEETKWKKNWTQNYSVIYIDLRWSQRRRSPKHTLHYPYNSDVLGRFAHDWIVL